MVLLLIAPAAVQIVGESFASNNLTRENQLVLARHRVASWASGVRLIERNTTVHAASSLVLESVLVQAPRQLERSSWGRDDR